MLFFWVFHSDTHSYNYNIGSTTQNALVEQLIGLLSMLAYYLTQNFDRKADQGALFMRFVGEKSFFWVFHSDTHSNACNIGSTTRNSSIEQPIGV